MYGFPALNLRDLDKEKSSAKLGDHAMHSLSFNLFIEVLLFAVLEQSVCALKMDVTHLMYAFTSLSNLVPRGSHLYTQTKLFVSESVTDISYGRKLSDDIFTGSWF